MVREDDQDENSEMYDDDDEDLIMRDLGAGR